MTRADVRIARRAPLYPLASPLFLWGLVGGALCGIVLGSLALAFSTFVLLASVGLTWRRDMPPIFPFCLFLQWVGASLGTIYFRTYGYFPGGGDPSMLDTLIWTSAFGILALTAGIRFGFAAFGPTINRILATPPAAYDPRKLTYLTSALFAMNYIFEVVPTAIWFGGAQIITNLLELRFIPYFVLVLLVFQQGRGYIWMWITTGIVLMPQLLTGFSDFKEIFYIIFLCALFQWRPWVLSIWQRRRNLKIIGGCAVGGLLIVTSGLMWSGGIKQQWRQEIWHSASVASPLERLATFFAITTEVAPNLDIEEAAAGLASRLSSGSLYFSYVLSRVPAIVPHEGGVLLGRAIENATVPRFLFPSKANLGGDSWLTNTYAGISVAGDNQGTSIGLGYMAEFYIDFGFFGVIILSFWFSFMLVAALRVFCVVSPSSLVFIALAMNLIIGYFSVFDGSFAKLFAGIIQRTMIFSFVVYVFRGPAQRWLQAVPMLPPAPPRARRP